MKTMPKLFLALCVGGLVIGLFVSWSGIELNPVWTLAMPLGAIGYGMFLMTLFLQEEMAQYDAEHRDHEHHVPAPPAPSARNHTPDDSEAPDHPGLTAHHAH